MKKRNLSAKKKIHKFFFDKLENQKIKKVYSSFKRKIEDYSSNNLCVALSGGADSMALAFLAKCYSLEKNTKIFYYIVDHKLRKESTQECKKIIKKLKTFNINCKLLTWNSKKVLSNIQSKARDNRYQLIFNECIKKDIKNVLTAHQKNDLLENFFIRFLRGSGLRGLSSFNKTRSKIFKNRNIHILRPLLEFSKKDLIYITKKTFNFYIDDPSNYNDYFLRVKIRKMIKHLKQDGLSFNKFMLTMNNLYVSNETLDFYVKKNIEDNSKIIFKTRSIILNEFFFKQPYEIVFRSFADIVHKFGKQNNFTRGNKISNLLKNINSSKNFKKTTLSGCFFEKVNKSVIISLEK